jgi:methylmalonyl-CoA mutase C-terminal domain/subunit
MSEVRKRRIVLGKLGLDGHDHGAKVVVRALMDAGYEVIYTGLRQTPASITAIAREHDADVIALSSMAGSHVPFCRKLKPMLEQAGLGNRLWMIGGNLPSRDHDELRALGFKGVFPSSSRLDDIVAYVKANLP